MEGVYIRKSPGGSLASLSALIVAGTVTAGLTAGPNLMFLCSGLGLALAAVSLGLSARTEALEKPIVFPAVMMGLHALLLGTAGVLHLMFLSPLPPEASKMPKLQTPYADLRGIFEVRGPAGWDYRPAPSQLESGVRLQPGDRSRYMGVSEATVFVRELDTQPSSPEAFLERAAAQFSEKGSERKLFNLKTEKGTALTGAPVMWSELEIKRLWVPLYQVSVFGVKNGQYLCSVSATGLKSHSALSRLLCLGLFERIKITDKPRS